MTNEIVMQETYDLRPLKNGLMIYVTGVNTIRIQETAAFGFGIPWNRITDGPPIRIGRKDTTAETPINPEIDLTDAWTTGKSPVSRIHAALEWREGKLLIRSVTESSRTWIRRSGSTTRNVLRFHEYVEVRNGDEIVLGMPKGHRILLRIRFRGSPH